MRSLLTLIFAGVVGFLWATGQTVPDELLAITMIVIGYYFGARTAAPTPEKPLPEPYFGDDA